jgi:GNAT superfamily N-acetyltransferase
MLALTTTMALGFLCAIEDACAEQRIALRGGCALLDSHRRRLWDANQIRVEDPGATAAHLLAEDADHHLGAERFRVITLLDEGSTELLDGLTARGYRSADRLLMALEGAPPGLDPAVEVSRVPRQLCELSRIDTLAEHPTEDPAVGREHIARDAIVATVVGERCYGVLDGGELLSRCQVFAQGPVAQLENVYTLAAHRRRGYASAVVAHATAAARACGASEIFALAEDDGSQPRFYEQLGFVAARRIPRLVRTLD